jgi:hypothetical protein
MYYVTMTDIILTRMHPQNLISKVIVECETSEEVDIVMRNARNRTDMRYINFSATKPYYRPGRYHTAVWNKDNASRMFRRGGF